MNCYPYGGPFYFTHAMELGRCYILIDRWHKQKTGVLIRTGVKGFNLLDPDTSRCIFHRAIYQKDSAKKDIPNNQIYFKMKIPSWISDVVPTDRILSVKEDRATKENAV